MCKTGVEAEFIKALDVRDQGSPFHWECRWQPTRLLRELQGISGQFDDVGRRNLLVTLLALVLGMTWLTDMFLRKLKAALRWIRR